MAAAAALAIPAAEPLLRAGTDLAKSVTAQIASALNAPVLSSENVRVSKRGTTTTKATLPAWLVVAVPVGIAVGMWVLGIGLTPVGVSPDPEQRVATKTGFSTLPLRFSERPRLTLPGSVASFSLF